VRVKTTTPEEDFWGYFEGERVWLGPPEKRPVEEFTLADPEAPHKKGFRANDNMKSSHALK